MTRYNRLMARIANGERVLIDAATGTEIERRGVPQLDNAWNGGGALTHPDVLRQVHADYIDDGAEIVIANTFATHRHALRDAGAEDDFDALNRRGVELAVEARDQSGKDNVLVAGGLSYWRWLDAWPPVDELGPATREQAAIMADAGADLLMLEMMVHIDRMIVMLDASRTSGLPVWVGLSCAPNESGDMALYRTPGETLAAALHALGERDVPLVNIMHTEVEDIDACLDVVDGHWPGPVGVYAHSATWKNHHADYSTTISSADYATQANRWLGRGVQVIGGCCGLGTEHVRALKPLV